MKTSRYMTFLVALFLVLAMASGAFAQRKLVLW